MLCFREFLILETVLDDASQAYLAYTQSGNQADFDKFIAAAYEMAKRISGEELAADVIMNIYRARERGILPSATYPGGIITWIRTVSKNSLNNSQRDQGAEDKRIQKYSMDIALSGEGGTINKRRNTDTSPEEMERAARYANTKRRSKEDHEDEVEEIREMTRKYLRMMSPLQQLIVTKLANGMKLQDIAEELNIPRGSMKRHAFEIRQVANIVKMFEGGLNKSQILHMFTEKDPKNAKKLVNQAERWLQKAA